MPQDSSFGIRIRSLILILAVVMTGAILLLLRSVPAHRTPAVPSMESSTAAKPTQASSDSGLVLQEADLPTAPEPSLPSPPQQTAGAIPPHKWQTGLVDTVSKETIEEMALHLGNTDDLHLVISSFSGLAAASMSGEFHCRAVTRLTRVRRLLEIGRAEPEKVIPILRRVLDEATQGWADASAEFMQRLDKEGAVVNEDSSPHTQYPWRTLGATYILAELKDYDSLPLFVRSYKLHKYPQERQPGPIPPSFTLVAMDRLISSYPTSRLSVEAATLRDEYLAEAAKHLLQTSTVKATTWNASYAESDPRIVVMDPKRKTLDGQSTTKLTSYPYAFTDGQHICSKGGELSERAKTLFSLAEKFVNAAYPQ